MKKILAYIMLLIVTLMLGGCGDSNYVTPDQYAKNQNKIIMESLKVKDKEKLKKALAEAMQNQENIDEEIDNLINFIDGNIVSYDEPGGSVQTKESTQQGITLEALSGCTRNIVTDSGKKYETEFYSYHINEEHADYVGVSMIVIYNRYI